MQEFGEWAPDAYLINSAAAAEASGVLPKGNSYGPFPQPATTSLVVGSATVTVTIAAPAVVSWTAHGFIATDTFTFSTTGALPTGITAGTTYFVIAAGLAANTFEFSTSSGGAAVNTTGTQSGVHTGTSTDNVIRGAYAARTLTNSIAIFALTSKKAWKFASVSTAWTNVSRATNFGMSTDDYWSLRQYGTVLLGAQIADNPQTIDVTTGTNFADLAGTPPKSKFLEVAGDFVVLGNTATSGRQIRNSARNNAAGWTAGQIDSDGQTFNDGGDVQGMAGYEVGGLIFQSDTMRRLTLRSDAAIYETHKVDPARGTQSPHSIVKDGADVYYYSNTGFLRLGGDGSINNIGVDRVNDWFRSNINLSRKQAIIGALDPVVRRIFWLCPSSANASSTTLDLLLCYDIERNRFTHATCALTYIFPAATPGFTLAALAALYTTLTAVPYPFGSDVWKGGAPGLAAFDANNKLCFFTGTPMAGSIQTSPFEPVPGRRAYVRGFRLMGDAVNAMGKIGGAERPQTAIVFNDAQAVNGQGRIPARISTRYAQIQIDIAAGEDWSDLQGIDFDEDDITQDGKR